jgi:hypothetical protein
MRMIAATPATAICLLLGAAVAACSGPASPQFRTVLQVSDEVPPLPVVLSDDTGLVTALEAAVKDPSGQYLAFAVRADPNDPNAFIASWLGGACDNDAALLFSRHEKTYLLNVAIHGKFGLGCTANGIFRDVRIVTSSPIPVDLIVTAGHT